MWAPGLLWWTDQYINRPSCTEKKTVGTWDAAVVGWEVGVAVGVGRLWRTSSGGGTGKTTGAALDGSLLTSKTSMGPVELLRRIWYFLCPLRDWRKHIHSLRHETQQQHRKRKYHTRNLQIRVWGPLVVCHLERGLLEVCPLWRKDRLVSEWWKLFRTADRTKRNWSETTTFECSTEVFMFYIGHSMTVLRLHFQCLQLTRRDVKSHFVTIAVGWITGYYRNTALTLHKRRLKREKDDTQTFLIGDLKPLRPIIPG